MPVSAEAFERLALEDPEGHWELHCGELVRKPSMSMPHNDVMMVLGGLLFGMLSEAQYLVRVNAGHARRSGQNYFIPDVAVIPVAMAERFRGRFDLLEQYDAPLPFVAEVWSRSTGRYDIDEKFPEYKSRGDEEIWRVDPKGRTVIAWRRQPDGSYSETLYTEGDVPIASLPGVRIPLRRLFAFT